MRIKRRTLVRIVSFLVVAVIALGGYGVAKTMQARRYQVSVQNEYARNFADLSEHLYNIETAFEKGQYASSNYQIVKMANQIWRETGAAKAALEGLPEEESGLYEVAEFLSKAGDYAYYVSTRMTRGETVGQDESDNMKSLAVVAAQLANHIGNLRVAVDNGEIRIYDDVDLGEYSGDIPGVDWASVKEQVSEYPELIYDGPFSDHIEKMQSVLLSSAKEISLEEAVKRLGQWLNVSTDEIIQTGEVAGKLEAWSFEVGTKSATVTKKGGYLLQMNDSQLREEAVMSVEDAVAAAQKFFASMGIENMKQSYYMKKDGEITVNFAYTQDGVIAYPDLIKVTVCLKTGDVCGYEAQGYLMAHRTNRDIETVVSAQEARDSIKGDLTVVGQNLAIIPTDGKNEVLCHELITKTADGKQVLVYINAKTGVEEMIQILIETEDGALTV